LGEGVVAPGIRKGRHPLSLTFHLERPEQRRQETMGRADQEQQLLHKLCVSLADGFTAESAGASGVLILNNGHYRGVWHWTDGNYAFTPGGYGNSTHSAPTPQDAVSFTLNHVCRQ
jgi:hypothetical protein